MNETIHPDNASNSSWPTSVSRVKAPDTEKWPDSEKIAPAAVGLLNNAVQGAHNTLDRFADSAAPVVRQMGEDVAAAEEALHAKTIQLRHTRDEWAEGMRSTIRRKPLVCVAWAFALGAVIARITR